MNFDFDAPYDDADPWGFRSRWYESRRRALVLACLPRQRFAHALELGCANGEMTASLAGRADALLALDASARAIALARQRVTAPHVRLAQAELPREWP
ncbi:MAG: methyltransferase, partial [Thauera sp.]|nr:methyltransferase [Thauera sp.]